MEITTVQDFKSLFPVGSVTEKSRTEFKSPCPFCTSGTERVGPTGIKFYGDDRFVWWPAEQRFFCRVCKSEGRGHSGRGSYFTRQLAERLNVSLSRDFQEGEWVAPEDKPLDTWPQAQVDAAQASVQRDFWRRFGWTDETIEHFQLGYGILYPIWGQVHLIPMQVQKAFESPITGYYMATRTTVKGAAGDKKKGTGSIKPFFWLIERYKNRSIVVVEGEKDGISASQLGWNVAVAFGTGAWTEEKTRALIALGYREVLVMGDKDIAGQQFNDHVARLCHRLGLPVKKLDWELLDPSLPVKTDITDVLVAFPDIARQYLEGALNLMPPPPPQVAASEFPQPDLSHRHFTSLEEVRGDGPHSLKTAIRQFLGNYRRVRSRTEGKLLLLTVGPGAGKSHTMVREAEAEAHKYEGVRLLKLAQIRAYQSEVAEKLSGELTEEERTFWLGQYEKTRDDEADFSRTIVAYFAPYVASSEEIIRLTSEPHLWYDFQARSEDNCANFPLTLKLAANNHQIGTYCETGCPFKHQCQQSGYLSQEAESRKFPIVIYRHQHLRQQKMFSNKELVIIDESPLSIVDGSPIKTREQGLLLSEPGWDNDLDKDVVDAVTALAQAAATVLKEHKETPMLIGRDFMRALETEIIYETQGAHTLETVVDAIPRSVLTELYQPTYTQHSNETDPPLIPRALADLHRALHLELADFQQGEEYRSLIHVVYGELQVHPADLIKVPLRTPVILADATGYRAKEMYETMFRRPNAQIYDPVIRNPNAVVRVLTGSDWTHESLKRRIGRVLTNRKQRVRNPVNLIGEEERLDDIPLDVPGDSREQAFIQQALDIILAVADLHTNLLVVTHMQWEELLSDLTRAKIPQKYKGIDNKGIQFGHYGALRGLNKFKDYEAALLLGMFRVPYDVVYRRAQVWMRHLWPGTYGHFSSETVQKEKAYDGQPGTMGKYRTFEDGFADNLVCMVEEGEMQQCMERIRPHASSAQKFVYICANRPCAPFVNQVLPKTALRELYVQDKRDKIRAAIRTALFRNELLPSYSALRKLADDNISRSTIKQLIDETKQEVALAKQTIKD